MAGITSSHAYPTPRVVILLTYALYDMIRVQRLSQDNQIKRCRALLLLGLQPICPAIGGGSEVTFKPLLPRLAEDEALAMIGRGRLLAVRASCQWLVVQCIVGPLYQNPQSIIRRSFHPNAHTPTHAQAR
ncbi:hypothetical protein J6590_097578 [Homalodisca vitripennis]|nr:hypothetical protein J6590_097578 [Homalodisca vitripennis]